MKKENIENKNLLKASINNDLNEVRNSLSNGVDIEVKSNDGITALIFASIKGNKEIVEFLLDKGANVEAKDDNGVTALRIVSMNGNKEIVELLLDRGADIEAKYDDGLTTLMVASMLEENKEIVELLLDRGADIEVKNNEGCSALKIASIQGNKDIVKLLLDSVGNKTTSMINDALRVASNNGHIEIVKLLLNKNGYPLIMPDALRGAYCNGHKEITELLLDKLEKHKNLDSLLIYHQLIDCYDKQYIELLLDRGANIDCRDNDDGNTPLINAIISRKKEIVELLLDRGADIEIKTKYRFYNLDAFEIASLDGYIEIVKLFIDRKYSFNFLDTRYAFTLASGNGHLEILKLILASDKLSYESYLNKNSAFISALENNKSEIVKFLIENGADINSTNYKGSTSLFLATMNKNEKIIKFLIDKGAKYQHNKDKNTPLIYASQKGYNEVVELLIEHSKIDDIDKEGKTALIYACLNHHFDIAKFLLSNGADRNIIDRSGYSILDSRDKEIKNFFSNLKEYNPQKLIKILTNFRKDTPIKYTTHLWDMNFNNDYGNFDGYMAKVTEQWEEIESELESLSPNIHRKVYDFLINTSPTTNWCSKDGDDISIGWSSLEGLKEWCDGGNDPFKFELKKSYRIENKTISTFGDVINLFKQEIQIRNENDILESIFIDIEERLDDEFDGLFEIETIKLKGKSFYTDVEKFKNVLDRIFSEIKKREEFNKIVVEMREYDDYNYMDLTITQIDSSANRTKEDMEKISNGGDIAEIKRSLRNLCDWSVETSYDNKGYRIDYLGHIDDNTEIESRGFTHRFRFYR
jgi:serine/threonine-protein phosphatase 6 regulatory ankyrin repeat subunit B